MPNYCIYLRKSRADIEAESHGDGETLARHEKTLLELAESKRISVNQIYREIVSAETISARPIMQKLLSEVENGLWDGVLVMEVERLARGNTMDQGIVAQAFQLSNTKIITPMKTYNTNNEFDEEYFEFGLFMSRREYKTINRRLQRGRIASVKEGKYIASQPPYGYKRKKLENDKGFTLEPNELEANTVKLIFELYTLGELQNDGSYHRLGTGLIANKLNNLKIPPKKGDCWVASSIRDILINPVYIGKIRWNWRPVRKKIVGGQIQVKRPRVSPEEYMITSGLHSPIIDKQTFDLAQKFMKQNPPNPTVKYKLIKNPLAGLIVCGKCGKRMVRRPYNSPKNKSDALICTTKTCNNVSCGLSCVEHKIIEALENWLSRYNLHWKPSENKNLTNQINSQKLAIQRIDNEIKKTEYQINKIHDLLEQNIYSREVFLERYSLNCNKIKQLKKEKKIMEDKLIGIAKDNSKKNFIPKTKKILEIYKKLKNPKIKNDILKQVLEKAVYTKDKSGRWHNTPDNFEIILYPKLPDSSDRHI